MPPKAKHEAKTKAKAKPKKRTNYATKPKTKRVSEIGQVARGMVGKEMKKCFERERDRDRQKLRRTGNAKKGEMESNWWRGGRSEGAAGGRTPNTRFTALAIVVVVVNVVGTVVVTIEAFHFAVSFSTFLYLLMPCTHRLSRKCKT